MHEENKNDLNIPFEEIGSVTYEIVNSNEKVIVILGKPQKISNRKDFYCPIKIETPSKKLDRWAVGIDEISAIQNSMMMINIQLNFITKSLSLIRPGFKMGDLGFNEWDMMNLKVLEGKLLHDKTLTNEERIELEKRVKVLLEKENELKNYNALDRVSIREKLDKKQ